MPTCTRCKTEKSKDEFYSRPTKSGIYHRCKKCHREDVASHPRTTSLFVKKRRGISQADKIKLEELYGNRCAICKEEHPLVVDHCHLSGRVRGLICQECNKGLGNFHDNQKVLESAIEYLRAEPLVELLWEDKQWPYYTKGHPLHPDSSR